MLTRHNLCESTQRFLKSIFLLNALANLHDWICNKLSKLDEIIFKR